MALLYNWRMQLANLRTRLCQQPRIFAYILGVCVVSVWTLLRFFTKRTIFDLVSQQVIVQQWLHGYVSTAHMGQTAYLPKMLLLYVPLEALPGSPRLKLILLTLAINATTFILLGIIIERMLREYHVRVGWAFYAALVWLSVIAGSVFWIEFADSRNLEVAGGILLLYIGLHYLKRPSKRTAILLAGFASLLFFSDPLQVYMTALALVVYAGVLALAKREKVRDVATLTGLLIVGYVVSKLLFAVTGHWLQMNFNATGNTTVPHLSALWLRQSLVGTIKATIGQFAGADDAGRLREVANIALLLLGGAAVVYGAIRKYIPYRLLLLAGCIGITDIAVYIASGQAVQGAATSRYLIMLAPALILTFASIRLPRIGYKPAAAIVGVVLCVNMLALTSALATHWNTSFPQDAHLASTYRYIQKNPGLHMYASIDTALPVLYLYSLPGNTILPLGCSNGQLVRTYYSMDQAFAANAASPNAAAVIVLDNNAITNTPNVCTVASITRQFGLPQAVTHTNDGSIVLHYRQTAIQLHG